MISIFLKKKILIYFLLSIIIAVGVWLRAIGVFTNSFSFTYDVGRDMLEVGKIVNDHNFTLIGPTTGLQGLFYGPWWYYILSFPFYFSGGDPRLIAFFISFTGILTILFMYYFGKKIGGDFLGLLLAFFVSVSSSLIGVSSQIWNPNLIPLLVVLVFLLIHNLLPEKKNKTWYFLLLGFILGLILDLEVVFGLLFLIGIFLSIFILFLKRIKLKQVIFILSGFFITLLPRLLFELRHDFIMSRNIIGNFGKGTAEGGFHFNPEALDAFKNLFNATFPGQYLSIKLILIVFFLLVTLIFYGRTDKKIKIYLKLLAIVLSTFFAGLSFFPGAIWSHYIIGIPILFILLAGLFIFIVIKHFKIPMFIIFAVFTILFIFSLNDLKILDSFKPLWEGDAAVYRNQTAVIDYIYQSANGQKFNYVTYTPAVHDYTYQYLFSWYGKKKYGYAPSAPKEKYFFLIIEPDYSHPFFLEKWLDDRKNDGKKIREKVVKGGIKVETRFH